MDIVKIKEKVRKLKEKRDKITNNITELEEILHQSKINNFKKLNYCCIFLDIFSKHYKENIMKNNEKTMYSNYYCKIHKCNHNDCPIEYRNRKYVTI